MFVDNDINAFHRTSRQCLLFRRLCENLRLGYIRVISWGLRVATLSSLSTATGITCIDGIWEDIAFSVGTSRLSLSLIHCEIVLVNERALVDVGVPPRSGPAIISDAGPFIHTLYSKRYVTAASGY